MKYGSEIMLKPFRRTQIISQINKHFHNSANLVDVSVKKNEIYILNQRAFAANNIQRENYKESVSNQIEIEHKKDEALVRAFITPYR